MGTVCRITRSKARQIKEILGIDLHWQRPVGSHQIVLFLLVERPNRFKHQPISGVQLHPL